MLSSLEVVQTGISKARVLSDTILADPLKLRVVFQEHETIITIVACASWALSATCLVSVTICDAVGIRLSPREVQAEEAFFYGEDQGYVCDMIGMLTLV